MWLILLIFDKKVIKNWANYRIYSTFANKYESYDHF